MTRSAKEAVEQRAGLKEAKDKAMANELRNKEKLKAAKDKAWAADEVQKKAAAEKKKAVAAKKQADLAEKKQEVLERREAQKERTAEHQRDISALTNENDENERKLKTRPRQMSCVTRRS